MLTICEKLTGTLCKGFFVFRRHPKLKTSSSSSIRSSWIGILSRTTETGFIRKFWGFRILFEGFRSLLTHFDFLIGSVNLKCIKISKFPRFFYLINWLLLMSFDFRFFAFCFRVVRSGGFFSRFRSLFKTLKFCNPTFVDNIFCGSGHFWQTNKLRF